MKTAVQKPLIFWTIDTEDWRSRDAEKTKNTILSNIKDGDIVLMHALYLSTAEACKTVIPELNARGYQLVTVSELIHFRGQDVAGGNGIQYKNFPPVAKETVASSVSSENLQSTTVKAADPLLWKALHRQRRRAVQTQVRAVVQKLSLQILKRQRRVVLKAVKKHLRRLQKKMEMWWIVRIVQQKVEIRKKHL